MNVLFGFLFLLAYFSCQLAFAEQSTRERIALHKKWLEQRETRKKLMQQEKLANNGTVDEWLPPYYRYYKYDLNTTKQSERKFRRKPLQLDIHLKSKRKKQPNQKKYALSNDSFDISTSTTTTTTTTTSILPTTSFVTVETTTPGITKSTDELQPNGRDENKTSEINSKITGRMNSSESTTNRINEITATTTEHSLIYNVTANNRKIKTNRPKVKKLSNAIWGRWQKWTKCSRSCGGGVMSQSRPCLSRDTTQKNRTSNECIGLQKRYRICNEQSCPEDELDFRDHQCVFYNNQSFHGKTYTWESYVVDEAECELNCKPIGMDYFAMLKDRVIDGTSCSFPSDFIRQNRSGRAMCVEGICKLTMNYTNPKTDLLKLTR